MYGSKVGGGFSIEKLIVLTREEEDPTVVDLQIDGRSVLSRLRIDSEPMTPRVDEKEMKWFTKIWVPGDAAPMVMQRHLRIRSRDLTASYPAKETGAHAALIGSYSGSCQCEQHRVARGLANRPFNYKAVAIRQRAAAIVAGFRPSDMDQQDYEAWKAHGITQTISGKSTGRSRPVVKREQPTDTDWDEAILRFQFFRRLEKPEDLRRTRRLPQLLSELAQEVYDIANELERTGKLAADLTKYGATKIADHIAFNGYTFEVRHRFVPLEFLDALPERLVESPVDLRGWAHGLKNSAERALRLVELYDECVQMLRGGKRTGRFPSVSMYWLNLKADEWGSTIAEIARQLLKRNVSPESKSDDPNPQRQWEAQLKKARVRARKRTTE